MPKAKRGSAHPLAANDQRGDRQEEHPHHDLPREESRSDSGHHQQSDHHRGDEVPHRVGDRQAEVAQLDREKSHERGLRVDHHEAGAGQCRADHELVLVPGERGEPHA